MALEGNFSETSFADLIQMIAMSKKSGVLNIYDRRHPNRQGESNICGEVYFERGAVVHVRLNDTIGEEAFYWLVGWSVGRFKYIDGVQAPTHSINTSYEGLLLEGTRRVDEWGQIAKKVPSLDAIFRLSPTPPENTRAFKLTGKEWKLLSLINGQRTVMEIAKLSQMTEFDVARTLYSFIMTEMVEIVEAPKGTGHELYNPYFGPPEDSEAIVEEDLIDNSVKLPLASDMVQQMINWLAYGGTIDRTGGQRGIFSRIFSLGRARSERDELRVPVNLMLVSSARTASEQFALSLRELKRQKGDETAITHEIKGQNGITLELDVLDISENASLCIYTVPESQNPLSLWQATGRDMHSLILLIDARDQQSLNQIATMLKGLRPSLSVPLIIASNNQLAPGALPAEQIAQRLNLAVSIPVVALNAANPQSVQNTILSALNEVLESAKR